MDNLDMCWWQQLCMWSLFCGFTVEPLLLDSLSYRHLQYNWHYHIFKDKRRREVCAPKWYSCKRVLQTKGLISMSCKQDCYHQLYLYLVVNTNKLKLESFTRWLIVQVTWKLVPFELQILGKITGPMVSTLEGFHCSTHSKEFNLILPEF